MKRECKEEDVGGNEKEWKEMVVVVKDTHR